jgi:hypothetical protein
LKEEMDADEYEETKKETLSQLRECMCDEEKTGTRLLTNLLN